MINYDIISHKVDKKKKSLFITNNSKTLHSSNHFKLTISTYFIYIYISIHHRTFPSTAFNIPFNVTIRTQTSTIFLAALYSPARATPERNPRFIKNNEILERR